MFISNSTAHLHQHTSSPVPKLTLQNTSKTWQDILAVNPSFISPRTQGWVLNLDFCLLVHTPRSNTHQHHRRKAPAQLWCDRSLCTQVSPPPITWHSQNSIFSGIPPYLQLNTHSLGQTLSISTVLASPEQTGYMLPLSLLKKKSTYLRMERQGALALSRRQRNRSMDERWKYKLKLEFQRIVADWLSSALPLLSKAAACVTREDFIRHILSINNIC